MESYSVMPSLPGAVDDPPGADDDDGDLEMGERAQRKKPLRNIVLTIEQKEKLQEWQQLAEHGFEIHRRAERYYEQVNFWTLSLPSVVLSAIATVWTLATEQISFPNNRVYIASISGLTTVVSSVGSYWRWQARMEKNRFASERYNSLLNRLTLLKARLQMGDVDFSHVLQEVENTIHEILKTCGPPDLRIQQRFEWEEKTSQFELLDRLTSLRDSQESPCIRCFFPCCWRSCMKLCPCCKRSKDNDGVIQPMTILNQKIREFSKKTQDVSVDEFKDYFWQLFRMASNSNNLDMCKSLIKAVPNSLSDEDVKFKSVEPSKKSPLHFSVQDNFHQLGQWLFETYPDQIRRHCLILDCHSKIPLDYMTSDKNEWVRWNAVNSREGGGAAAFYTRLLFETFQQWCMEMSDLRSFEDKERMKRHGKGLYDRIQQRRERHVDIACSKRHTVLHVLAVHGVEEQEPLKLLEGERGYSSQDGHSTLLSLLINAETGPGPDTIDGKDTAEHKAPLELAAEQRHAGAFKLLLEAMLKEIHELEKKKDDSKKADRCKTLRDVVEKSLLQLYKWPSLVSSSGQKGEKDCCSCAPSARFQRLEAIKPMAAERMADFAHMKIQRYQEKGKSCQGTLLHLACGADSLIDITKLSPPNSVSLAKLLLESNAFNSPDSFGDSDATLGTPKTPLQWAIEKSHWGIAWDMCEYGVSKGVKDIVEDIGHCLQAPAEEFSTFWLCQDTTAKATTNQPSSLYELWLYFSNGTKICLNAEASEADQDGSNVVEHADAAMSDAGGRLEPGGFMNKAGRLIRGLREHRLRFKSLEIPVAPVAFRLETTEDHGDKTAARAGLDLKASGQKDPGQNANKDAVEEPQLLIQNIPLKEWVLTPLMEKRQKFMNNAGGYGSNRETLLHLSCRHRNVPLVQQLLQHSAHYTETGTGQSPLDLVGCGDSMREDPDEHEVDDVSDAVSPRAATVIPGGSPVAHRQASAAGSSAVDEESRELAKLLIFLDYRIKLDRFRKTPEHTKSYGHQRIVEQYQRRFHLDERAMICMRDHDDKVLLHWAAMYGHYADVEWLLKHGAQVVVYDQLAFHDFRVTIVDPSRQRLEQAYGEDAPFPEFCWRKTPRKPPIGPSQFSLQDMPACLGMRQESVSEMVTWNVGFERPERLDGFRWSRPQEGWDGNLKLRYWALEARSSADGLALGPRGPPSTTEEWVLLNIQLERFSMKEVDFEKGEWCELHTQRTPLDYALELSGLFSDGGTDENHAERHSTVCKLLIDEAVKCEKQQEGRRGTLIRQTLASYCRPCVRVRTLSKKLVDLTIKEEGISSNATLLHVASKHGLVEVCSELVRRGCIFRLLTEDQSPLDVAMNDQVHESLIVPSFISICKTITNDKTFINGEPTYGCQEDTSTLIDKADQRARVFLWKLKSENKPLGKILRLKNPHEDNYGIIDYATMFGLKGFLKNIIDRIPIEIEDDQPVEFRAELIGTALPRSNSKDLIDEIRALFADNAGSDVEKKKKLKRLLNELKGLEEEEKLCKVREHQIQFYHLASIATEKEAVEIVKLLLKEDPKKLVKLRDPVDNTALHLAAKQNNLEVVKLLCDSNANTEVMNMTQERPLHLAARTHSYETVEYLIVSGASPHICNSTRESPLHLLAKNLQHFLSRQKSSVHFGTVMQVLIDRLHGDKDHQYLIEEDDEKQNALDYLIQGDHQMACDPIAHLVSKLPDALRHDVIQNYIHVLTQTKTSCSHQIVQALLRDVDPKEKDRILASRKWEDLFTPLQRAAWNGHVETMRVILDILGSLASKEPKESLRKALEPSGPDSKELEAAVTHRSNKEEYDPRGLEYNYDECVKIKEKHLYTFSPFRLAVSRSHVDAAKELARRLLELNNVQQMNVIVKRDMHPELRGDETATLEAEINRVIKLGDQSLLAAVKSGKPESVEEILEQNPTLAETCRDVKGNTPLHYALDLSPLDQEKMCKLLLSKRASLDPNNEGRTPLQVVCQRRAQWKPADLSFDIQYDLNSAGERYGNFLDRCYWDTEDREDQDQLGKSDELGENILAVDIKLTEQILTSAQARDCLQDLLAAKTDDKTVFDLLCQGLENAAFHDGAHELKEFLHQAWLKPLESQTGDFEIPGRMNMTLLALAVLVCSDLVEHFLTHGDGGDPLKSIWGSDTPLTYALYLQRYDLVKKMLQRVTLMRSFDRLVEVLKDKYTKMLFFKGQEVLDCLVETLEGHLVEFLTDPTNLEECFAAASPSMFEAFRNHLGAAALANLPKSVSEWRFGSKEWTVVHILASIGDFVNLKELLRRIIEDLKDEFLLHKALNAKDIDGNSPLHHVVDFIGCIHVRYSSDRACRGSIRACLGCYFPQKASDRAGSLYYKKFGHRDSEKPSVYIRLHSLHDRDQDPYWMFESDRGWNCFHQQHFKTSSKVSKDFMPMNKLSWTAIRGSHALDPLDDWKLNGEIAPQVARLLISYKADIDCQNLRGRTPLQACLLKPALKCYHDHLAELSVILMGIEEGSIMSVDSSPALADLANILVLVRDSDGLNAMEAAANISWFEVVWRRWLKALPLSVLLKAEEFCRPLNVSLEHGWHPPQVRRMQTLPRLVASFGDELRADEAEQADVKTCLRGPGFSSCLNTCLLHQQETLLKNITCDNLPDLGKIWLVPEPLDERRPLYRCYLKRSPLYPLDVDFIDIVEQTYPRLKSNTDGSIDVCIGVDCTRCFLQDNELPRFLLNGTQGECQRPRKSLRMMEFSFFRAVGLPGGPQGSGKFYYEVELSSFSGEAWGIIGWAKEGFSFSTFETGDFMGFAIQGQEWIMNPEECELPVFDSRQDTTWWDDQDVFFADASVFGLAVDLDKGLADVTRDGEFIVKSQHLDLMGCQIFPILHTSLRPRIKLRSRDWKWAGHFPEYKSWVDDVLEPSQQLMVRFKNVTVDSNYYPWNLELEIQHDGETFSKLFRARSLLATAIWNHCSSNIFEVLRTRGCPKTPETIMTSLQCGSGIQALKQHDGESDKTQYFEETYVPWLRKANDEDVEPWVFCAFLMYLQCDLAEEEVKLVCDAFDAFGADIHQLYGEYVDVKDETGAAHPVDGIYARCDDGCERRLLYRNLCRSDQYILYDKNDEEPMFKLGLTSEFLEGGQPPRYFKTPNLEDGKLTEVVAGKEKKLTRDHPATQSKSSKSFVKGPALRKERTRSMKESERSGLTVVKLWTSVRACLQKMQSRLRIPQKNADIYKEFCKSYTGEGGSEADECEDVGSALGGDEPTATAASAEDSRETEAALAIMRAQLAPGDDFGGPAGPVSLEEVQATVSDHPMALQAAEGFDEIAMSAESNEEWEQANVVSDDT